MFPIICQEQKKGKEKHAADEQQAAQRDLEEFEIANRPQDVSDR